MVAVISPSICLFMNRHVLVGSFFSVSVAFWTHDAGGAMHIHVLDDTLNIHLVSLLRFVFLDSVVTVSRERSILAWRCQLQVAWRICASL